MHEACFLITMVSRTDKTRVVVALKVSDASSLPEGCVDFPMRPENKSFITSLLGLHIRLCGPVVNIKNLAGIFVEDINNV